MFDALARDERLLLLRFVCAFAWTDLEVKDTERAFVHRLVKRLELSREDASEVETWLHVAAAPGSVDPKDVPTAHRRTFIEAIRAMMYVDGEVDTEEREQFERLKTALLG